MQSKTSHSYVCVHFLASEAIRDAFSAPSEWELLPGWHQLGDKGAKKKVVRCLSADSLRYYGFGILSTSLRGIGLLLHDIPCTKKT